AAPVVAVDLPSGLDAGRAEPPGPHVQADLTVTFAAPKVALLLAPAARAAGELVVADLGIPPWVVEEADGDLHLLLAEELAPLLAPRRRQAHKGDFGHLLLVAGSAGKAGAAILAARGAVRSGAGLVTVGVPEPLLATVDGGSLESMTLALPAREGRLGAGAVEAALAACEGRDALGMGPGLGTAGETGAAIRDIALRCPLPLLLDADAINAFAGGGEALRQRRAPTVLTPHAGELGRLLARATDEVVADRLGAAREAADRCRAVVVLKGHQTLVAAPEGGIWINPTGNPGLATGGTGDVLTGVLSALLAQGFAAARAAGLGAYVHGLAGDLAAGRRGQRALAAADLLDELGAAFEQVAAAGGGGVRRRCWRRIAG
ncbi:MAG TPA: NAD(P)H-hydrate dehydratase, partial [Thermoanaerobaculia bacterium]|nr:NAD(P)H-hydrate dehydratase [Thermoanaerobaculia bacterium]